MVVRTRLRAVLRYFALYCGAGLAIAYFSYHAMNGDHGVMAARLFDQQTLKLGHELDSIRAEREALERRIALLKPESVDPDMLDEKARQIAGLIHPAELVVMLPGTAAKP